jgi:hypothetical protein
VFERTDEMDETIFEEGRPGSSALFNPAGKNRDRVETMNPLNGFTVGGDVDSRR